MRTASLAVLPLLVALGCTTTDTGATGPFESGPPPEETGDPPTDPTSTTGQPPATTGADSSDTGNMDDNGFVPEADMGGPIVMCDTFSQDCPDGEKCVPFIPEGESTWTGTRCVEVTGAAVDGDPCLLESLQEPNDGCDEDHLCWELIYNEDNVLEGVCRPFCAGTSGNPTCEEGASCLLTGTINVCLQQCHPLFDDCGDAKGCYLNGGQDFFVCQPISGGYDEGAPCTFVNDCNPGLFCAADASLPDCISETGGCCTALCDTTGEETCTTPTECTPFFDPAPPNYDDLGLCVLPG